MCRIIPDAKFSHYFYLMKTINRDIFLTLKSFRKQFQNTTHCAFHFVKIFHYVEIQFAYCLYLQKGLEFLTKFWYPDQMLSRNIFKPLYLKAETSALHNLRFLFYTYYLQISCMVSLKHQHWGYPLKKMTSRMWSRDFSGNF